MKRACRQSLRHCRVFCNAQWRFRAARTSERFSPCFDKQDALPMRPEAHDFLAPPNHLLNTELLRLSSVLRTDRVA